MSDAWNVQVSTGALGLGWQHRLASIYAATNHTPEILQTLSSGISCQDNMTQCGPEGTWSPWWVSCSFAF